MPELHSRLFLSAWAALLLAFAPAACAQKTAGPAGRPQKKDVKKMSDVFTRLWDPEPAEPASPPEPIRPVRKPLTAPRAAADQPGALRRYGNDRRNSRAGAALRLPPAPQAPAWTVRWKAALEPSMAPYALLASGERFVVHGPRRWSLFDAGGRSLATTPLGNSEVILDDRYVFAAAASELIFGYHLSHGQPVFSALPYSAAEFVHPFLARHDRFLLVIGISKDYGDVPVPPETSIELFDLRDPAAPRSWDQPGGATVTKNLLRETRAMLAAIAGDTIVLATTDRVYLVDFNLNIQRAMTGSFAPIQLALDEGGRLYMVVSVNRRFALWLLPPQGEQLYAFDFPQGVAPPARPPIVGYDHTAYIVSGRQILSVAPDGKLNWMRAANADVAGAVVTADDLLVVSEGDSLTAWDAQGQRRVIHTLPGESLATAPVLLADGDVLVATQAHLYRLGPAARPAR